VGRDGKLKHGGASSDVRELAVAISRTGRRCDRLVERYLLHQVIAEGRYRGTVTTKELLAFMVTQGIRSPPGVCDPFTWAGMTLQGASTQGVPPFTLTPNGKGYRWSI